MALLISLLFAQAAGVGAMAAPATATRTAEPTRRVDLYTPRFSNPTHITNPLFPISRLRQVIQLGHEGDEHLRHEITLLPNTKFIRWNGQRVEVLVSQFVAYGDGRILETAVDYFAQDDRGAVWYFGEDVYNYVDGVLDNRDGTWLAGRVGPPGMIMPAHPRVGDVYRPENIPGLVFEEVTVKKTNQTVPGPKGLVRGTILVQERLMDGVLEDKVFAPGYGEFLASVPVDDELVKVAVAFPTDRVGPTVPKRLWGLASGARRIFDDASDRHWAELSSQAVRVRRSWEAHRDTGVPPLLDAQTDDALDELEAAIHAERVGRTRQAAINLTHATFDLHMQYRDPLRIDHNRTDVWKRQLFVDAKAENTDGVNSDLVILEAIDDRIEQDADD